MNLEGLTERWSNNPVKNRRVRYFDDSDGLIVAKVCTKCSEIKPLSDFSKYAKGLGGKKSVCKTCLSEYDRHLYSNSEKKSSANETRQKWREENRDRIIENSRNWREKNRDKKAEYNRKWRRENPVKASLNKQRRRARKAQLPDTLTIEEYLKTLEYFGNACALTGETRDIEKEHAIPLFIGHGGTTFENCYPMAAGLNQSKSNHNILEWFNDNKHRFRLDQSRFDRLIGWLANVNKMTVNEYRDFVYWCHANPRDLSEEQAN